MNSDFGERSGPCTRSGRTTTVAVDLGSHLRLTLSPSTPGKNTDETGARLVIVSNSEHDAGVRQWYNPSKDGARKMVRTTEQTLQIRWLECPASLEGTTVGWGRGRGWWWISQRAISLRSLPFRLPPFSLREAMNHDNAGCCKCSRTRE